MIQIQVLARTFGKINDITGDSVDKALVSLAPGFDQKLIFRDTDRAL